MAAYRFLLVDASTGNNIGELPLTVTQPITRVLNGVGVLTGTMPLIHPLLTTTNLETGQEITVLRNDTAVWNGPITSLAPSAEDATINITAQEASVYFQKRTLEVDKHYTADIFYILNNVFTAVTTKTATAGDGMTGGAGTDINAALPRFTVSPTSGSGYTRTVEYFGAARHLFSEILDEIVGDPNSPIDWKMDYTTGSTRQLCQRTMKLGAPLGTTHEDPITERVIAQVGKEEDRIRAANRVHVVGAGQTVTLQNASSILTNDDILIEAVFDRSDTTNLDTLQAFARSARLVTYPPVTSMTVTFPAAQGPFGYGWCDLGDKVYFNLSTAVGILYSTGHRRVVQVGMLPDSDSSPELFTVDVSIPLDTLT